MRAGFLVSARANLKLILKIGIALVMNSVACVQAAPITFNTALPVAEDEFLYRQQLRWLRSGDDPSGLGRDLDGFAAVSVLGYGVNSRLAVFGVLPWTDKSLGLSTAGMDIERNNHGIGNLTGFVRYTLLQDDAPGRTFRLSGFGGLTAPTGNDDESDQFGRLPQLLQDGSSAWSGFGGLVLTWQTLGYQFDGQFSYQENREANGFEFGDETRLDMSWQHRLWPRNLGSGVPGFLYGVLELNALHQSRNRLNGQGDPNSGGETVWLSPGLQFVTQRWVLEAVAQKPVSQNLNGVALENDLIFTLSFRIKF